MRAAVLTQMVEGAEGTKITFALEEGFLRIDYEAGRPEHDWERTVFVALGSAPHEGSPILPYAENFEGSTVFLPFPATRLYLLKMGTDSGSQFQRTWKDWSWSERSDLGHELDVKTGAFDSTLRLPASTLGATGKVNLVLYSKAFDNHQSWGHLFGSSDSSVTPGPGDKYIPYYFEVDLKATAAPFVQRRGRLGADAKVRIYQLFVRLFGNTNETRKANGTLAVNGVGKFHDINDAAIASLKQMGFSHVWLTGVLQQATATDYSAIGQPADDPDLLKGLAGSPYAIKDYFDVCPDYAQNPAERLNEFKALLERLHAAGLQVIIDLVPNHVARSYDSDVKPEWNFGVKGQNGQGDNTSKFFDAGNNFFYLTPGHDGPPLRLPTCKDGQPISPTCQVAGQHCDGLFDGEKQFGRVTGNNVASWTPALGDWYETVKLNYGFDFTDPTKKTRVYPHAGAPEQAIPDTWKKMDAVLAYWQAMGVDGFRCDMSHMEPPEFWKWTIGEARQRQPRVFFMAEAYDNDPAKVPGSNPITAQLNSGKGNVMFELLEAGFNYVYDDPTYRALKKLYEGPGWANDIDTTPGDGFIFDNSLRYAENHDEVRIAAPSQWAGIGAKVGRPVAAILYSLSRGAVMVYNGQEVGEPGTGAEGFGGDDARTSIFDYWSMPELSKWVNGHTFDGGRLSPEQKSLREFYSRLVNLTNQPAFRDGKFFPLNPANHDNPKYLRASGEEASGHWVYSFLRFDPVTGQRFLVVVNLHKEKELKEGVLNLPTEALEFLQLPKQGNPLLHFSEKLDRRLDLSTHLSDLAAPDGLALPPLAPLTPYFFEITTRPE